jgi:hypothetical protein
MRLAIFEEFGRIGLARVLALYPYFDLPRLGSFEKAA